MKSPAGVFVVLAIILWLIKTGKVAKLFTALTS